MWKQARSSQALLSFILEKNFEQTSQFELRQLQDLVEIRGEAPHPEKQRLLGTWHNQMDYLQTLGWQRTSCKSWKNLKSRSADPVLTLFQKTAPSWLLVFL